MSNGNPRTPMPAAPPESVDTQAIAAKERERRRGKSAYGQQSTILTSGQGAEVTAQRKTVLGS